MRAHLEVIQNDRTAVKGKCSKGDAFFLDWRAGDRATWRFSRRRCDLDSGNAIADCHRLAGKEVWWDRACPAPKTLPTILWIKGWLRQRIVPLLLVGLSCASFAQVRPTIDVGWVRMTQGTSGWLVNHVFQLSYTGQAIRAGDTVFAVDGRSLTNLNPLSIAWVLNQVPYFSRTADVLRAGRPLRLNFFREDEPLLRNSSKFVEDASDFKAYPPDALAPPVILPDTTNQTQKVTYGPKWTLIHLWEPHCAVCWKDIPTLNEISHPTMESLSVVTVVVNGTPAEVNAVSKVYPVEFSSLYAGEWGYSQFLKEFNVSVTPADILVDPKGVVLFVGAGRGSLSKALEMFKDDTR